MERFYLRCLAKVYLDGEFYLGFHLRNLDLCATYLRSCTGTKRAGLLILEAEHTLGVQRKATFGLLFGDTLLQLPGDGLEELLLGVLARIVLGEKSYAQGYQVVCSLTWGVKSCTRD